MHQKFAHAERPTSARFVESLFGLAATHRGHEPAKCVAAECGRGLSAPTETNTIRRDSRGAEAHTFRLFIPHCWFMESFDLQFLDAHCDLEPASGRKCYTCSIFFRHSILAIGSWKASTALRSRIGTMNLLKKTIAELCNSAIFLEHGSWKGENVAVENGSVSLRRRLHHVGVACDARNIRANGPTAARPSRRGRRRCRRRRRACATPVPSRRQPTHPPLLRRTCASSARC